MIVIEVTAGKPFIIDDNLFILAEGETVMKDNRIWVTEVVYEALSEYKPTDVDAEGVPFW